MKEQIKHSDTVLEARSKETVICLTDPLYPEVISEMKSVNNETYLRFRTCRVIEFVKYLSQNKNSIVETCGCRDVGFEVAVNKFDGNEHISIIKGIFKTRLEAYIEGLKEAVRLIG